MSILARNLSVKKAQWQGVLLLHWYGHHCWMSFLKCFKMSLIVFWQSLCTSWWISESDTCSRSSGSLINYQGYSSAFEVPVPLETSHTLLHSLIAVNLPEHAQCLCNRLPKFDAKFSLWVFILTSSSWQKSLTTAYTWSQKRKCHSVWSKYRGVNQPTASWWSLFALTMHATTYCHLLVHYKTCPEMFWYHLVCMKQIDDTHVFNNITNFMGI